MAPNSYLYQLEVDDEGNVYEQPIGFTSKGFSKQQQRWGTPDKEAFGIYYCVKKFDHILRDISFTIKTDHKNLLYLDKDPQAKIRRYKLALQEYDCIWEHIDTHANVVADDLSRLCSIRDVESYEEGEIEWLNTLIDEFKLPPDIRDFIGLVHNSKVGHLGVEKTTQNIERLLRDDDIYKETRDILMSEIEESLRVDPHGKTNDKRYIRMRKDIIRRDKQIDKIMTRIKPKEFIQTVLINEIGELTDSHPYISFILMGIGIEFIGKCIDKSLTDWNVSGRSKQDFENAIKAIPSLKKYEPYLASHQMYSSFRCGLAHAVSPKLQITLSSKQEMAHLVESNGRLNLKVEDFYNDFKDACNYIISQNYTNGDKMNADFLEVTGLAFNSGTTINSGITSSLQP